MDDGSTDGSLEAIKRFGGQIRWETGPNRGGNVARNRLLTLARGEWLQYLDADDYLLPDKIAKQMELFDGPVILLTSPLSPRGGEDARRPGKEVDVVFGPVTLEHWSEKDVRRELLPIPEPQDPWVLLARWYLPQTGASLWRKQAILDVGGWKPDQPCCQEHELYLRLLMAGKRFAYCASAGAVYRQWGEHTVCKHDKPEVRRRRLEIEQHAEDFLRPLGELTPVRQGAINTARLEIARVAWRDSDRSEATSIAEVLRSSAPDFRPSGEPICYRLAWKLIGFRLTETLAGWRRSLIRPS